MANQWTNFTSGPFLKGLNFLSLSRNALLFQTKVYYHVGFEILMAVSTKMAVFWVVAPCSLVEVYQHFRGPCCSIIRASETLVNFYQTTWRYNPEDSRLRLLPCSQIQLLDAVLRFHVFTSISCRSFLILSSHLLLCLHVVSSFEVFWVKFVFLVFPSFPLCLNHLIHLSLITLPILV
jgi:hypothetical protein